MKILFWVPVIVLGGCSKQDSASSHTEKSVAALSSTNGTTVAFTGLSNAGRLAELVQGGSPKDFLWIRVQLPGSIGDGPTDLASKQTGVRISQTYYEGCDIPRNDYSPCVFLESFAAGDPEVSGAMMLGTSADEISASFDFKWSGITERWGSPVSYEHGTIASYEARLQGAQ